MWKRNCLNTDCALDGRGFSFLATNNGVEYAPTIEQIVDGCSSDIYSVPR